MFTDLTQNEIISEAAPKASENGEEKALIPIRIDFPTSSPEALEGKYSMSFIDEMSCQLTDEIVRSQAVAGIGSSTIELRLVFSPETYMEHTSENLTYRRLLLTDKGCSPRDFWVKWTRLDSAVAYSVSDTPAPDTIKFEIGEDVPQKVREREYRYLVRIDADKYQGAMSRKNVTEWREILKRAIKRGDMVKVEEEDGLSTERDEELRRELSAILGVSAEPSVKEEPIVEKTEAETELMRLAREALMGEAEDENVTADTADLDTVTVSIDVEDGDELYLSAEEDTDTLADMAALDGIEKDTVDIEDEPAVEALSFAEAMEAELDKEEECEPEEDVVISEERIRAEIEAKLRLEYESRARLAAEEEAARLRREQELLRAENERLMEKARRDAEAKAAEEARLKAEIEAKLREEAEEKERIARAAMLALHEKRRLEAEREAAEREAAERARAEEERRLAEERAKAEEERIRREAERAAEEARALAEANAPKYISRTAEFSFRRIVDPNITKRIYEIVKATIEFYHKEDVYIRIKASVPDSSTVRLEFLEVPEEEGELVVNIIKALGKSDLGIAKATLD